MKNLTAKCLIILATVLTIGFLNAASAAASCYAILEEPTATQKSLPDGHWLKTMSTEQLIEHLKYHRKAYLPEGTIYETISINEQRIKDYLIHEFVPYLDAALIILERRVKNKPKNERDSMDELIGFKNHELYVRGSMYELDHIRSRKLSSIVQQLELKISVNGWIYNGVEGPSLRSWLLSRNVLFAVLAEKLK